jgi:hypothetical protein
MASTGSIELGGKQLTWTSPTIADLEHLEAKEKTLLTDLDFVNSAAGRRKLAAMCLKKEHGLVDGMEINTWLRGRDTADYLKLWPMIREAIPFWGAIELAAAPEESQTGSSPTAPSAFTGPPASPEESE